MTSHLDLVNSENDPNIAILVPDLRLATLQWKIRRISYLRPLQLASAANLPKTKKLSQSAKCYLFSWFSIESISSPFLENLEIDAIARLNEVDPISCSTKRVVSVKD